ncbi:glycosyltransferase family 4 protein [Pseudanabaena sp. FACHB-2040]|uniref:glycosyltransferase family 4 protein n=1 Tax=Pseudanabaena sp. FACHB-2040 TaxID=2692859 RepID=UPI0016834CFD|nr:glycosyltransferase family 4 protein [Pseudanabaena sp. FACHB-2040]MBD2256133.1 glycosyltransferase family 4 protein [Pseudanabaena sp. FACHB-2040]
MKILLVNDYATLTGGAEMMMQTLQTHLRSRGHDARLFASTAQKDKAESIADYECFGTTSRFRTLLQTANPWAAHRLHQVLTEFRPDVVHVRLFLTQLSPLILKLLQAVPSILHIAWYRPICPVGTKMLPTGASCHHSVGVACYQKGCLPLRDWVPLMAQHRLWQAWQDSFDVVVSNSFSVHESLLQAGIASTQVIWNGVPVRPQRPLLTSAPTVAYAGRLASPKGVDVLLQAFAKVVSHRPEATLLIAGQGTEKDSLTALTQSLNLQENVLFLGHLSREEMERRFASAWVQVIPSRWAEPFGIVATEAMMRGTAVISSDTGGLAEIVADGQSGFLVPPGAVEPLADKLLLLLQDRDLAEQMGQAGRDRALLKFSESACVNQFVELYQTLLASKEQGSLAAPPYSVSSLGSFHGS